MLIDCDDDGELDSDLSTDCNDNVASVYPALVVDDGIDQDYFSDLCYAIQIHGYATHQPFSGQRGADLMTMVNTA